jgi:hypothetical protein
VKLTLLSVAAILSSTAHMHAAGAESSHLAAAVKSMDESAIHAAVEEGRRTLGDRAGVPDTADKYVAVPADKQPLSLDEARRGYDRYFQEIEKVRFWEIGVDPGTLRLPLRVPAAVLAGNLAVCRAGLADADRSLALAKQAAEFLRWAQEQGGAGCFPFPAARGVSGNRAMEVGEQFLRRAEQAGKLGEIMKNGWIVDDLSDGGLQFDNAECGVAMFEFYEYTGDGLALASARKAAEWALARPLVPNWNYNSFSAWLLAKAYRVTGDERYREGAVKKSLLGVIPGQLTDGPRAGRWMDPHNARPAYHYIMLRALAEVAAVLPQGDRRRAEVMRGLALGLKSRNAEIVSRGVMNKDKAVEALVLVDGSFASDEAFLRETLTREALLALTKLVSAEARAGKAPLGPREWGLFLEYLAAPPARTH